MLDILNKTVELNIDERVDFWLEVAEEVEAKEEYPCSIEDVNDTYLKDGIEKNKLYGFYEDSDLEMFFTSNNINITKREGNTFTLSYNDNLYSIETVDLINRHGDDLPPNETVYQLHTLTKL